MKFAQCSVTGGDCDLASHRLKRIGKSRLMPDAQGVNPRWHIGNLYCAPPIGDSVIRGRERYDDGAHLSMDVAKNVRNSGLIEQHVASGAGFIESEIEALAFEQGKYIVKKRIAVWKIDAAASWYNKDMGIELLVFLNERVLLKAARPRWIFLSGSKPDYNVAGRLRGMIL